jgi:phosphoglucosamine mutase
MVSTMSSDSPWVRSDLSTMPLFGTDGIRGRVGERLTAPLAVQIGFWTGVVLREVQGTLADDRADDRVAVYVGQDSRSSGDMLAAAIAAGLCAAGVDVWLLGLCPTPTVAWLTNQDRAIGGLMISASHNPPQDNGIKVFGPEGMKLAVELQARIEAGIRGQWAPPLMEGLGRCFRVEDRVEVYAAAILGSVQGDLKGCKVVLDLAWGAAAILGPQVFRGLGAEVIALHDRPDGALINVDCGSTHLQRLQAAVLEHQADFGFAFDGDADRVLAVDNLGRIVDGDYILYIWGRDLMDQGLLPDNTIISTVMANLALELAWKGLGGEFIRTKVGDQFVQAQMLASGAMLGGEQSGHILCKHFSLTGDGILCAIHLSRIFGRSDKKVAEIVEGCFVPFPQRLFNVRGTGDWMACDELVDTVRQAERALEGTGRVLVRASGTEPLLRIMIEAIDEEVIETWGGEIVRVAEKWVSSLEDG